MKYYLRDSFIKSLKRIKRSNPKLTQTINKQLKLFAQDSSHPSLRNHKLKGALDEAWSISIDRSRRMLYVTEQMSNE